MNSRNKGDITPASNKDLFFFKKTAYIFEDDITR